MVSHSLLLTNATYPPLQCKMTKREIHHKYPSAEDGLKEWNPYCEKCMIRRKTVQQCAPGHEVYNDEGNVSYGNFPPVVLINKWLHIDSVGGEESMQPTCKTCGKEASDDQGTIHPALEAEVTLIYAPRQ